MVRCQTVVTDCPDPAVYRMTLRCPDCGEKTIFRYCKGHTAERRKTPPFHGGNDPAAPHQPVEAEVVSVETLMSWA